MARKGRPDVEKRTFIGFLAIVLALLGLLVGANIWGTANATPKLGLDLEGGTQMVLTPRLVGEQSVTTEQIAQARDIIAAVAAADVAGPAPLRVALSPATLPLPQLPCEITQS